MTKSRTIHIKDIQLDGDEKEIIEMTMQGTFSGDPQNYRLEFEEIFAEDMKSKTVLRVKDGACVNLLRQGDINSELIIEQGKRHNCHYLTPYGDMVIGIDTLKLESCVTDGRGSLRMIYSVDFYGNVESVRDITIEFR